MIAIAKVSDRLVQADIDDEIVVMRLDTGEFYSLTGTGASIWRLIDGSRDRDSLVGALAAQFEADKAEITADVDDFLRQLKESGLLAN